MFPALLLDAAAAASASDTEGFFSVLLILAVAAYGILLVCAPIAIWRWTKRTAERQEETNAHLENIGLLLERIAESVDYTDDEDEDDEEDDDNEENTDEDFSDDEDDETGSRPSPVTHITDPDSLAR